MDYKKEQLKELNEKIDKKKAVIQKLLDNQNGAVIEAFSGRYKISRDYEAVCESNKKLKRLIR